MAKPLRLGTRRSTLAWAQSLWVAEQVQVSAPGQSIELVPIETRGDRITDVPLREVEGKEFFSAEIDQALLTGAVDITVHSLKDLSLERPAGIALGAIPRRENPRDVIVFHRDAGSRLARGECLRIGTSAPRRVENVPRFLERALPGNPQGRIECIEIRGNVDTRLGRLHEADDHPRKLDGVVLAFAGLARLWRDQRTDGGRAKLTRLLRHVRWMVLPITDCPSAPGQGALAIECRRSDDAVRSLLGTLNDVLTAHYVGEERRVLAQFGGGCHQQFGATCVEHPNCGALLYVKGRAANGEVLDRVEWLAISDHQQAVNALLANEIDALEAPPHDLLPLLKGDSNVALINFNPLGNQYTFRPNHLQKPFDNPKVRQALLYAFNQKDFLDATIGNAEMLEAAFRA